ncbi:hypothetical protein L3X38_030825 [Prunus dulcis]|uniref:Uncharacterized protein n=1 Tax=Prunus dulcis TaxID=3755 RepID=A0AAD4VCG1_PRUDU|nr:hypothetical protein L3X38_030825 [Prunus dulcis]
MVGACCSIFDDKRWVFVMEKEVSHGGALLAAVVAAAQVEKGGGDKGRATADEGGPRLAYTPTPHHQIYQMIFFGHQKNLQPPSQRCLQINP